MVVSERGRPTKLTQNLLAKFQEVLDTGMNVLVCTDAELLLLLNEKLEEEERISEDSFKRYKAWSLSEKETPLIEEFCTLYKRALVGQRTTVLKKLMDTDNHRQKFAWIMERKFDERNLKMKQEVKQDTMHSWSIDWNISINIITNGDK